MGAFLARKPSILAVLTAHIYITRTRTTKRPFAILADAEDDSVIFFEPACSLVSSSGHVQQLKLDNGHKSEEMGRDRAVKFHVDARKSCGASHKCPVTKFPSIFRSSGDV